MIHFIPDSESSALPVPAPYAEAVERLASIRQAMACVEQVAGAEPAWRDSEARLAVKWAEAGTAAQRCFAHRSQKLAAGAAAGIEAMAALADQGGAINPAAARLLARELGAGLDQIDLLFSL